MAAQQPARASPELRVAPLSPRYRRNYTTPRGATSDVDLDKKLVIIRDRKDPRHKDGNDQKVPLLTLTGYDAWQLLLEQKILTGGKGRVFPYHHKSAGTAFQRGRNFLGIETCIFMIFVMKPPVAFSRPD